MDRLMTQKQVCETVALSRQMIFKLRRAGNFPEPVQHIGAAMLRWRASDISEWMAGKA